MRFSARAPSINTTLHPHHHHWANCKDDNSWTIFLHSIFTTRFSTISISHNFTFHALSNVGTTSVSSPLKHRRNTKSTMRTHTVLIVASLFASTSAAVLGATRLRGTEDEIVNARYQKLAAEVRRCRHDPSELFCLPIIPTHTLCSLICFVYAHMSLLFPRLREIGLLGCALFQHRCISIYRRTLW